jgi:hypothetical protein
MNCCDSPLNKIKLICPHCSQEGNSVETLTLQSLLQEELLKNVNNESSYKYCKTSTCDISYFSKDYYFLVSELKVKATDKDQGLDVPVCYCFNYSRESILKDIKTNGESNALKEIKYKMKDPGCFCERSNPQGNCCLGNVTALIKQIMTNQF